MKNKINVFYRKYIDLPVAAKATLWFMICSILQKGISFITTPIFTRLMSTSQYGQYGVYNSWSAIFCIFTTYRLDWAVFNKGMSKYKDDRDGYAATMQTVTFVFAAFFLCIYFMFRTQFNKLTELPTFIMIGMFVELMFIPATNFWTTRKRYDYEYKSVVARTLFMAIANAVLGVFLVYNFDEKGYARILSCIIVNMAFGISLFLVNYRNGKKIFDITYAKFAIVFNTPLMLHYISQYILDQFDRVMIQKMCGLAETGIYNVAYNVGMLMKIVTNSINGALVPWQYSKLEERDFKRHDDALFAIYCVLALITVGFSGFAPEMMLILGGDEYRKGAIIVPAVALAMFYTFMYTTIANVEFYYELTKFTMYISMLGALINIGMNYVGIKIFGYAAAAYSTAICYFLFSVGHYIYLVISLKKKYGYERVFDTRRMIVVNIITIIASLLMMVVYESIILRYAFIIILIIILYMKRDFLKNILKEIKKK